MCARGVDRGGLRRQMSIIVVLALVAGCYAPAEDAERVASEGLALARSEGPVAARPVFERALLIDPWNPKALYNGGLAAFAVGDLEDARAKLERFVAAHRNDAIAHYELARIEAAAGRRDEALALLARAIEHRMLVPEALEAAEFEPLRHDLRFVQLAALLAQRIGARVASDDRGRVVIGHRPIRALALPGLPQDEACLSMPRPGDEAVDLPGVP